MMCLSNVREACKQESNKQLYEPHSVFYNFNCFDGKCYIASNPALGTLGDGENVGVRLDDDLIDRKICKHVLIAPVAISGTCLEECRPRVANSLRSFSRR